MNSLYHAEFLLKKSYLQNFASDDVINLVFKHFIRVQFQLMANKGRLHIGHMVSLMIFNSLGYSYTLYIRHLGYICFHSVSSLMKVNKMFYLEKLSYLFIY